MENYVLDYRKIAYEIEEQDAGRTVLSFLKERGFSARVLAGLKRNPYGITIGRKRVTVQKQLKKGDLLTVRIANRESQVDNEHIQPIDLPLKVLYEDEDVRISYVGQEKREWTDGGGYYTWNLADISLKQGWNRLTPNFKTAKTDNAVNEFTFEGITEFRIAVNKNSAADLTVALDNTEVCVLTIAEDGKVIEPITDTHTTKQLAIAAGITAVVIGGATAACYVMAKKEEKRRRRQRRARALAKKQQENTE